MSDVKDEGNSGMENSDNLLLVVDGGEHYGSTQFKVPRTMKLRKLMSSFCQRFGIAEKTVKFLFDGERITENSTPMSMGMENGDQIEIKQGQSGGNNF